MTAALYLSIYLAVGLLIVRFLLPRRPAPDRVWLGLSLGLLLLMWLPALTAFVLQFSVVGHLAALPLLLALGGLAWLARDRREPIGWTDDDLKCLKQAAFVVIPLTVYSAYIQYTHVMRIAPDGSWNVGQSTYGDLPMHLSFITGLKDAAFPADYPFYPGHRLSYPFLTDSLSTTFYLFGWSLQAATVIPAVLMMALCFLGVMLLGRQLTVGKRTAVLAALLFFLNGGLGFLYDFDQAAGWTGWGGQKSWNIVERVRFILEGYYKTPTNQPDPNNLRWSNVIVDLMVPQRTLLGGWCMVLPCFYLLWTCFVPDRLTSARSGERPGVRGLVLLGVWGGLLPLIHTHSFTALGLASVGVMVYDLLHGKGERLQVFFRYLIYGVIAAVIALPQLILFTFGQVSQGMENSNSFIALWFNWVNNPAGDGNLRDFYFWFYIKNIGLPFLALILALFEKDARRRRLFACALPIILAAELIRFQPNIYDNNKLLYLAWLFCCMIVADWGADMWTRLKGLRARPAIAVLLAIVTFLSAGLTLWREAVSDYQAFSAGAVEAGEFVRDQTPEDAVFLTGRHHLNPVSAIAGRTIVCGPDLWLYWHGFDTSEASGDIERFFADPEGNADVLEKYGVSYIYVSSYERSSYYIDTRALEARYERVFANGEAIVYRVTEALR